MKHVKNVQNVIFLLFHAVHKDKERLFGTFSSQLSTFLPTICIIRNGKKKRFYL